MKKLLSIIIAAFAASSALSAVVTTYPPSDFAAEIGGRLVRVEVFSTNTTGTVSLRRIWSAPVYSNATTIASVTSTNATASVSNRVSSVVRSISGVPDDFSPSAFSRAYPIDVLLAVSTNVVTVATTNSVPVYVRDVAVTNTIASGSCAANVYTNTPSDVYLAPGDRLRFSGTATGGWVRLITE